eukprot:scaffold11136_cov103-Alexandrium_tamarense.AAC.1
MPTSNQTRVPIWGNDTGLIADVITMQSYHLTVQKGSSQPACHLIDPTTAILRGRTTSPTYNSEL